MPSPESQRALAEEWEREKRRQRGSFKDIFKSHAAPFFVAWIFFGVVMFSLGVFVFHVEVGLAVLMGVIAGLFAGLRIILKVRR